MSDSADYSTFVAHDVARRGDLLERDWKLFDKKGSPIYERTKSFEERSLRR